MIKIRIIVYLDCAMILTFWPFVLWDGWGVNVWRVFLQPQQGAEVEWKILGAIGLIQVTGFDRRNEDEEVWAAVKLRGELQGVGALSAALPGGGRHRNCLLTHLISTPLLQV